MENLYEKRWIGYGYDLLASLVWLPSKNKLYDKAVSLMDIKPNTTILELGCGTGFLTKKLMDKQAVVTSVDQSTGMLARSKARVPEGKFVQANILQYKDPEKYDYVVLFFVLHELSTDDRKTILNSVKKSLNIKGKVIICDFSIPEKGILKTFFPKLVGLWENQHTMEVLKNGFYNEIKSSLLKIQSRIKLYNGRVQFLELKPD